MEQERLTLTDHLSLLPFCFVCNSVFVLLTFSTHMSSCFAVYYEFHVQTMFDSFLLINVICIDLRSLVSNTISIPNGALTFDSHMTVSLVEQKRLAIQEHQSSPRFLWGFL